MAHKRSINSFLADVTDLIEDMTNHEHSEDLQVAIELAHQIIEEYNSLDIDESDTNEDDY